MLVGLLAWEAGNLPTASGDAEPARPQPFALNQDEPALPEGLESEDEPALPEGLEPEDEPALPEGLEPEDDEPALPEGLESEDDEPALPEGLAPDADDEPALPAGLSSEALEPALPPGLEEGAGNEPALPAGLGTSSTLENEEQDVRREWPVTPTGFLDLRGGVRLQDDPDQDRLTLAELRMHLGWEVAWPSFGVTVSMDAIGDGVLNTNFDDGDSAFDVREANVFVSPFEFMDVRVGRQILTWGTGDLIFVHDLFPKDWNAFLSGRDVTYLKAPSDAVKLSVFLDAVNVDIVYTPQFDPDRVPDRRRISTYDLLQGRVVGESMPLDVATPDEVFFDSEIAGRVYGQTGRFEWVLYGYWGFWKSPAGFDGASGQYTHPALSAWGASVRGPLLGGLMWMEGGYYDSRDDRAGTDPFIDNSQIRALVGYEHEMVKNLTLSAQYYTEVMIDHDRYLRTLPEGLVIRDQSRQLVTVRLTGMLLNQDLTASLFAFVSPTDRDAYLRPRLSYRMDDHWRWDVGGNLYFGEDPATFFGQFEAATHVWAAVQYGF